MNTPAILRLLGSTSYEDGDNVAEAEAANPPGAATNIFTTPIRVPSWARRMVVTVVTGTSSVFNRKIDAPTGSLSGAAKAFNGGVALAADVEYAFIFAVAPRERVNFTLTTNGTLSRLMVEALRS